MFDKLLTAYYLLYSLPTTRYLLLTTCYVRGRRRPVRVVRQAAAVAVGGPREGALPRAIQVGRHRVRQVASSEQ